MAKELFSKESEIALLGILVKNPNLLFRVSGAITSEDFYFDENKELFKAMEKAKNKDGNYDAITLLDYLDGKSSRSRSQWNEILLAVSLDAGYEENIDQYLKIIKDKAVERKMENVLKSAQHLVKNDDSSVEEKISKIDSDLQDITNKRDLQDFRKIDALTEEFSLKLKDIEENGYNEGKPTGIKSIDWIIGGFKPGDLIIVAARPSMGKTAFALELSKNIAAGGNVGFFSLEMPAQQLYQRISTSEAMLGQDSVRNYQKLSQNQKQSFFAALSTTSKLNIWIDDSPNLTIETLVWKAKKLDSMHKLDLVVIDYLQLLDTAEKHESRQVKVSEISRKLKILAREINVPVIALSQLSRGVENREDKRPRMSDIRESGAIEQDADIIMLLYRDAYYNQEISTPIQELEINVAKNRNGRTGKTTINFNMEIGKVFDKPFQGGDN